LPEEGGSMIFRNTGERLLAYVVVSEEKTVIFLINAVKTLNLELKIM
jgi:hypothetical protein